jgi:tetratricopeptide (TPR) repeat protein
MIWENTKILLKLYYRPLAAMSRMIDEGNWLYGAAAVALIAFVFQLAVLAPISAAFVPVPPPTVPHQWMLGSPSAAHGADHAAPEMTDAEAAEFADEEALDAAEMEAALAAQQAAAEKRPLPLVGRHGLWLFSSTPNSFITQIISLALLYVPATMLLITLLESLGGFGLVLRRDYGTLTACVLMAWAAAHLPFALAGLALLALQVDAYVLLALWLASSLCFGALVVCALRVVFGASYRGGVTAVCISWVSISFGAHLFAYVSPFLFSPFLVFYGYQYFRGEMGTIGLAYRQRQNFKRFLDQATLNPRDAEAHYQLGLVYLQRRQEAEAVARFRRAVEIDAHETDAQFQLGRIARERGRLPEAIERFGVVVTQDERHSRYEIWREIGATYIAAGMHAEAREALERYVEQRPFDPEGLYYLGRALRQLGDHRGAQELFKRCLEAVQTMPYYRRGEVRKWRKMAQEQLSSVPA